VVITGIAWRRLCFFGLNQIWLPIGLLIGAYLNWTWVAKRLRVYTEKAGNALTLPAYFDNRFHDDSGFLRVTTAIVILVFFTFYAAAGFVGGALLFETAFHVHYLTALWVSASFIMIYTGIGGFLAVNWVDFFQGTLMFFALIIVPTVTLFHIGGIHSRVNIFSITNDRITMV